MNCVDTSLAFRREFRRLFYGWVYPKKIELEESRRILNEVLKARWPELIDAEVFELIYDSTGDSSDEKNYIVFIDVEFDVDFYYEEELEPESNDLVTQAAAIGARRCAHLPQEQILELKRIIGQAVLSGIRGSKKSSEKLAKQAAEFLKERTVERSRYWTLNSAHALALFFGLGLYFLSGSLIFSPSKPDLQFGLWIGALGGLVGAYLSVIQKAGSGEWDAASGCPIHFVEVFTRIVVGIIFGCLSFVFTKSSLAPPSLAAIAPESYTLLLFAIAAGMVERMIPKMVAKYSEKLSRND